MLWAKVTFLPKNADFLQEISDVSKIKRVLTVKGILCNKFQVSSIILTSFRQGDGGNFSPFPPQIEPLKSTPRLQWKKFQMLWLCSRVFKGQFSLLDLP